jgi:hypothetical protein
MKIDTLASTQYDDLKGTASLDFDGQTQEFNDFCKEFGVDMDRYSPVGLEFYKGQEGQFNLKVLAVDNKIKDVFQDEHGKIPIEKLNIEVSIIDFFEAIHRFHVVLFVNGFTPELYGLRERR